jgi:dTDP-4-dehydrorhamnose reductase
MKVLVAGAGGQLGKAIAGGARALGFETLAFDRRSLDVTDFAAVSRAVSEARPDVVINCSAYNRVDDAEAQWREAFMVNGVAVRNLAHACRGAGPILVHFGTDYVFDGEKGSPYTIADRPNPLSRYGESKLLGEDLLRSHVERYYLIRTSWVFGGGKSSFPDKLLKWASGNKTVRMVDDQVSSPTYAEDLATGTLKLIMTENYGLYHMSNSGFCSRYEWAAHILRLTGWNGDLQPAKSGEFASAARRPAFSALDNFPISHVLGSGLPPWQEATERFLKGAG